MRNNTGLALSAVPCLHGQKQDTIIMPVKKGVRKPLPEAGAGLRNYIKGIAGDS